MDPLLALGVLAALVVVATALGLMSTRSAGRARRGSGERIDPDELGDALDGTFGSMLTLLQFSSDICSRCPGTRRLLRAVAAERDDVSHAEVDLTRRPDLAARFHVMQTPTTFILDRGGAVLARIGGSPRRAEVAAQVDALTSRRPAHTHEIRREEHP